MSENYKRKPNTQCKICGKEIYRRPHNLISNKGNAYCSQECYGLSCRRNVPCVICGTPILGGLHKKTCSRACANKNRAGIKYKTGSSKNKAKIGSYLKSRLVHYRTGVCEVCGYSITKVLDVHHIVEKSKGGSNDSENLLLLCKNCHGEIHHRIESSPAYKLQQQKIKELTDLLNHRI